MELYTHKGTKKLAYGYTTGSCAAAASKAAAYMYFTGEAPKHVKLMTPKKIELDLDVLNSKFVSKNKTSSAVKKQSGDDPDITNGVMVYAELEFLNNTDGLLAINIDGGTGVGRVTKKGLEQPVGAAAINSVPRKMIADEVKNVCEEYDFNGTVNVTVSIPEGIELARKTFNPRLGIEGGISVLGTSGIVEPMSEKALVHTIKVEMKVRLEENISGNKDVLLAALGNYGRNFMLEKYGIDIEKAVKCSNYIGETIDIANELGVKKLLLVGHVGKLIKVSGGIMNTHSANADARLELLSAHALRAGADSGLCRKILDCVTTDEALLILKDNNILEQTMEEMIGKIAYYINKRSDLTQIEVLVFSNELGELAHTKKAYELLGELN
jgi:cobalt-precorrin-5B (C1)-methyltransferase